jgi:hypothetical protein
MVEYRFIFESDKTSYKELEKEAEDIWNARVSAGLEANKYHDTQVKVIIG